MTREQIEKAANDQFKRTGFNNEALGLIKMGFRRGAEWRINSVWHSPDELPRIGSYVVAVYEDSHIYFGKVKDYSNSVPVKTWAYIDDLMPELHEE